MKTLSVLASALGLCAWGCANPPSTSHASDGREHRASGSPSPPLEERAGERRPLTILDAAVCGDILAGCRPHISGVLAANGGLLSLSLSSKGGEGNGAAASEHRDACKVQRGRTHSGPVASGGSTRKIRPVAPASVAAGRTGAAARLLHLHQYVGQKPVKRLTLVGISGILWRYDVRFVSCHSVRAGHSSSARSEERRV